MGRIAGGYGASGGGWRGGGGWSGDGGWRVPGGVVGGAGRKVMVRRVEDGRVWSGRWRVAVTGWRCMEEWGWRTEAILLSLTLIIAHCARHRDFFSNVYLRAIIAPSIYSGFFHFTALLETYVVLDPKSTLKIAYLQEEEVRTFFSNVYLRAIIAPFIY